MSQRSSVHPAFVLALAGLLAGCTVGPDFKPTQTPMPISWVGAPAPALNTPGAQTPPNSPENTGRPELAATASDLQRWWALFNDPLLSSLISRGAVDNLDVRQAEARIRQARATAIIAGSAEWPSVDASASATRSRTGGSSSGATTRNAFRAGFDATWEIDIFGGIRRGIEAANADINTSIEDRRSVLVSLAAEIATTYYDLRGTQQQLIIARRNLDLQKQTVDLTEQRFRGGFVSALDVANAQVQVANTTARIPTLETTVRQLTYSLDILLGQQPGSLIPELSTDEPLPQAPPTIPVGLPSDLLRRRPDIRAAEAALHSATARIGIAVADLYPRFSLTGSFGTQGTTVSALGTIADRFWAIGPAVTLPIFNAGRLRANIEVQRAMADESFVKYQQAVLASLQDVENSLVAHANEAVRRRALADALVASRQSYDLATQLYTAGRTDFLNVLTAQRALFDAEDALVQSDRLLITDVISLYKALGGGWDDQESTEPASQALTAADPIPAQTPSPAAPANISAPQPGQAAPANPGS